jgi:hypothetical protein
MHCLARKARHVRPSAEAVREALTSQDRIARAAVLPAITFAVFFRTCGDPALQRREADIDERSAAGVDHFHRLFDGVI